MLDVSYVAVGLAVVLLGAATAFAVGPPGAAGISPAAFEDTLTTGMTGVDVNRADQQGYAIPRGQVFYTQYQYVVGYHGIGSLVAGLGAAAETGQFGQPLAVYVTDFSNTEPMLTDEGFVRLQQTTARGWIKGSAARYVVESGARTPGGPAVLPFAKAADARAFAEAHGGEVIGWQAVRTRLATGGVDPATRRQKLVAAREARADAAVGAVQSLRNRPVSVTVGEEAQTLAAAVATAQPNTTIFVPPGRYDTNLTISKPVTIRGAGSETVLDGGGTGTVLTVRSPRVAVTRLAMTGVGQRRVGSARNVTGDRWDERIRLIYGRGDAAIRLADAHGSLVADVTIETPSNGVVALNSSDAVVRNLTVRGSDSWQQGSMGVLAMYSDLVVAGSTIVGGRDGVYTHHADGIVVRNNTFSDQRFGVHEMYTSDALVTNNTARGADVGLIVMTRPTGNVLLGNDVRESDTGISVVGAASHVAGNVLANNHIGLTIGTDRSVYTRNTLVRNDVGIRHDTLLPTNDVTANDVVRNDRFVRVGAGTQNVWARDGRGNYWGSVPGFDRDGDGVIERPFRPADRIDRVAVDSAGAFTLSRSPAVSSIREFQSSVPGLRGSSVIDPAPLTGPVRPSVLDRLNLSARQAAQADRFDDSTRHLTPAGSLSAR